MNIRRSFLALTAMILSVGFFSAPAMAAGCSAGPINVAGDYIADHTGDCVINGITAGGRVSVKATGSITINGPTTAGGDVSFEAQGGNAQVGAVTSGNSGSISIFSSAAITALDLDSAGSLALFSSGNITVTGMAKAVWNVASEGGGNINISGAVTSGASYLAAISTTGAGNTLTLGSTVTAGALDLIAPGNIHVIGAINSISVGSHVDIKNTAAGGTIKLDGTITAPGQKVQIVSFGNISTKTIDTTSTTSGVGDVRIIAHKNATGAIPAFVIGGSANSNGVNGSIIANTQTAGGQSPYTTNHNVGIVNGGTTATGGITLVNGNNISVAATASKAGCIALDARNGPFTLQAGILSADGAAGQSAGCIVIAADTVTIGSNGTIRANDDGTKGYNHYVAVATRQLGVTGTVNMQADGKGVDTGFPGAVLLLAEGSLSITIPEDYLTPIPPPVRTSVATTLTVNGSGSLVLRANGAINRVDVVAKPITFSNTGTLTITANGASQNAVRINNPGATSGVSGLSFTGGNVTVRSDGVSGVGDASGGYVEIFGDQMTLNANTHTFSANGPAAGNGNGGRFYLSSTAATLKNTGKVTVTANAASAGSGNAILGDITTGDPKAIQFFPGSVNVDAGTANGAGQYSFAAKGGSTGGNGGTIYMGATSMTIKTANAIVASAIASGANNGDGGEIYLNNYITVDAAATVSAIGKGTGKGGKFRAFYFNPATALNVNTVIKVNGGNSLPVANFHGQIKLNSVTCRQWKNANATFPKSGWHCINPDAPSPGQRSIESSAFTLTPASLKTDLLNQNTHIYSMDTINEFQEFFYGTSSTTPGIFGISIKSIRVSVAFDRQVGGSAGGFSFYYPGTILHELGHTWDGIKGNPSTNAALTFMSKVDADVNSFNAMTCANAITATTGNATYCTTYAGQTNFWIYQKLLGFVTPGTTDYQEAWARSFGHRGQSSIPNPNKNFPTFVQNIEELMTQQKAYMNTIFTTGVPF